jgi:glycosyltransferase involved in cell wall biosynthesis
MNPIAFFLPNLNGGGAERISINLLQGMAEKGIPLDLVLGNAEGPYLDQIPKSVRVINLAERRVLKAMLPLSSYLRDYQPSVLLSHQNHANVIAIMAKKISGTNTQLVLVEHNTLSASKITSVADSVVKKMMKWIYPLADVIIGVSHGVSQDLEHELGLPPGQVVTIYNPIVNSDLFSKAQMPLNHPWFQEHSPPVFLAVGRLTEQKDFTTLIQAFAQLRKKTIARLIILGEGESRAELEAEIHQLGISEDVSLPGFVDNPYAYMKYAKGFVLSSRWEGLPTVLVEAMACGCSVISTNCPSGPQEILEDGKYGAIVPVEDPSALCHAMLETLANPFSRQLLEQRAMHFSLEQAVSQYLAVLM